VAEVGQREEQLQPGIGEERDPRDVSRLQACLGEAVRDGVLGELLGVLVPGEPLFFGRRDDRPVGDDGRRGIVGAEVEAEDNS